MYTESALRHGPSATLLTDKTCSPRKLTRSLSQHVNLPRGRSERVFDGKQFATLEYQSTRKSNNESDMVGKLYSGSFDTAALNLGAQAHAQSESNKENSAVANAPVSDPFSLDNVDRMKNLEALAVLRQGKVIGDGTVFRQTFVIRSYEVGSDGKTSMSTIVSLFQEVAINHFSLLGIGGEGFGATPSMNLYRLIWVVTKLHVEVERYPTWPEAVYIDSWTDGAGKNGMLIDWQLHVHATGEILARGTSIWAMMNQDTRRLSKLPDEVRAEIQPTFVTDKRRAIIDSTLERIPKLDSTAKNIKSDLRPAKPDLDGNQHVNNVTYVRWILESVPAKTWDSHDFYSITLEYRRECKETDVAESLTDLEPITNSEGSPPIENPLTPGNRSTNGNGSLIHFIHLLRMQEQAQEIVRARTVWQQRK